VWSHTIVVVNLEKSGSPAVVPYTEKLIAGSVSRSLRNLIRSLVRSLETTLRYIVALFECEKGSLVQESRVPQYFLSGGPLLHERGILDIKTGVFLLEV
jgi:hypothetical protein